MLNGGEHPHKVHRAFYIWANSVEDMRQEEKTNLERLAADKIYLKLFEVEKNDVYGIFPTAKTQLYNIEELNGLEIIPTVYVRNEVFKQSSQKELAAFADNLNFLVHKKIGERFGNNTQGLHEIQIDCDWTESTQKSYFAFLEELKRISGLEISATLRLYAYKFPGKMGVLPVDRAMLMCYNLLSVHQSAQRNSILDLQELEKYLAGAKKYPVPLDVALPLYSAMHVYQNNSYVATLYHEKQPDEKLLEQEKKLWHRVREDRLVEGLYLRKGDKVKYEKTSPELLLRAISLIRGQVELPQEFTVSLFQLNAHELKQHTHEKVASYYRLFESH